jgi:methionine aminopeptidase
VCCCCQGEEEEVVAATDLSNSDVTTKYQEAAKIVNLALSGVVQQSTPGAAVADLCKFGDTVITQVCQPLRCHTRLMLISSSA